MIQHFFLQNIFIILIWEDFYHIAVHYSPNKMSTYPYLSYESDIWKGESRQENIEKQILSITLGCGDLTKGRVDPGSTKITYVLLVSFHFFFFLLLPTKVIQFALNFNLNSLTTTTTKHNYLTWIPKSVILSHSDTESSFNFLCLESVIKP